MQQESERERKERDRDIIWRLFNLTVDLLYTRVRLDLRTSRNCGCDGVWWSIYRLQGTPTRFCFFLRPTRVEPVRYRSDRKLDYSYGIWYQ